MYYIVQMADFHFGGASSGQEAEYTEEDLYWLSRIISAESRGESLLGQMAVGSVILNRRASGKFPTPSRA